MKKFWLPSALVLLLTLLASCSGQTGSTPLDELITNDNALEAAVQPLLDEAAAAFSDLTAQSGLVTTIAAKSTLVRSQDDFQLVSTRWQPSLPLQLPPVDRPLFVTIKVPSRPRETPPQARLAFLRQNPQSGQYELEWFGQRGVAPVRTPARVQISQPPTPIDERTVPTIRCRLSFNPPEIDIICTISFGSNSQARMHIVGALPPDALRGRHLMVEDGITVEVEASGEKVKEVCCGRPKPFPALWSPVRLHREDLSVVAVPYDNPRALNAQRIEELVGENLGFLYIRKKPFPSGTTTDCGPNRVWCPSAQDPFLNLRLVRNPAGGYAVQLTKLNNPEQVIATLPAQVALDDGPQGIGIEDNFDSPNEPTLRIKWPKIRIKIIITVER